MCFSILPTFILGLPGATKAILGIIEGLAEALSYSMRTVSGVFSDKFRKRKAVVFIGYVISTVVKPLFAATQTTIDALIIRVVERIGKGVRTSPRDALLSESVSKKRLGVAFGLHRTLDQTGAILGPVFASTFMLLLGLTIRDIFWLSFIPGFAALFILLILVKERVNKSRGKIRLLRGVKNVIAGKFSSLLLIVGLFSIGAFNFSFVLLRAKEIGMPENLIPIVYALINVSHTAIAIPAGLLSDRVGKEKVLVIGYGIFLFSALLLSLPYSSFLYAFLFAAVYGVYVGIVETIQRTLVPAYSRDDLRGTAYGLYYLIIGVSFLVANITVGSLWEYINLRVAAGYSIITSITAIIGMMVFLRRSEEKEVNN